VKKRILTIATILAVLALPAIHSGCGATNDANASTGEADKASDDKGKDGDDSKKKGDDKDAKREEAVPVEVAELGRGPIESVLRFSTNLEAESQVQVFSQAKRLVTELLVEEGDRVSEGQVLLRLQDDEQRSMVSKAENELAKAQREYKRQERLHEQELISEQEWNDATYNLEQLRISLDDARRELGYTEVKAPISGTVTARRINLGDQVQIGQHLFDLVDFDSLVALVYVPEKHLSEMRQGLEARVSAQVAGGADHVGRIKRIAPVVDPKTGTVKVTVDVSGQAGLRPGMYVDVELVTATRADALLVPKRAVVYDNDQMFVYRLNGEKSRVERVFIEPRLADKHNLEPSAGLAPGDQVVVAGQAGLKDGALVSLPGAIEKDQSLETADEGGEAVERASL
jgi:membrane fusion protein (multidrug efflux system)